jgi:hypothetical protein
MFAMKSSSFDGAASADATRLGREPGLVNFHDARRLHYRGLLLPLGKLLRALAINVHAREFLAVRVIDSYLPVMMFAPFIVAHSAGFLGLGFSHVDQPPRGFATMAILRRARK